MAELEPACASAPARIPLTGTYDLLLSTAEGGSNGKVGPFVGSVTQEFVDEKAFVNAVALGPLKISLNAQREVLDDKRIRVKFVSTNVKLFGQELFSKEISGTGIWKQRYVDSDANLRVMDTPSLFILQKRS